MVKQLSEKERLITINRKHEEIEWVVEHFSNYFLSTSGGNCLSLSPDQQSMMRELFGDVATGAYKKWIESMEHTI